MNKLSILVIPALVVFLALGFSIQNGYALGEETIELEIQLVDAGSDELVKKFKDEKFRKAIEDKINEIWAQVCIKFTINETIEKLDGEGKDKKKKFTHHDQDGGKIIHIFLVPGAGATTDFKDEKNRKPGEGIITIGDGKFKKIETLNTHEDDDKQRKLTAEEALGETFAHEIGHVLGLNDVLIYRFPTWFNIMFNNPLHCLGTELGTGDVQRGDLDDQEETSRKFAQAIKDIVR